MAAVTKNRNFFKWPKLVGINGHNFGRGAIQESFQQNLVDIGSVVSEEKIFLKFHPPFFLICIIGQNRQKLGIF
jgi:UV DNA damage repair endonuclease